MSALHTWTLEPLDDCTRVITTESISGWLAQTMSYFAPNFLDNSLKGWLAVLKNRAEQK
jgi:hypothetical protein